MNYYLDDKKVTPEQLKEKFEEIPWSYDCARVIKICKITSKSIYFKTVDYKI